VNTIDFRYLLFASSLFILLCESKFKISFILEYGLLRLVLWVYYQFTFKPDGGIISLLAAVEL